MYRELTSQERDYLCEAFRRFAAARSSVDAIDGASDRYQAELNAAGIVYTSRGFRVHVEASRPARHATTVIRRPR